MACCTWPWAARSAHRSLTIALLGRIMQQGALSSEEIAEALDLKNEIFKVCHRVAGGSVTFSPTHALAVHMPSQKRHWSLQPCSAVTGDGLVDGIDWMVKDIASRIFMME